MTPPSRLVSRGPPRRARPWWAEPPPPTRRQWTGGRGRGALIPRHHRRRANVYRGGRAERASEPEPRLGGPARGGRPRSAGWRDGPRSGARVGEDSRAARGSRIRAGASSCAFRPGGSAHRADGRPLARGARTLRHPCHAPCTPQKPTLALRHATGPVQTSLSDATDRGTGGELRGRPTPEPGFEDKPPSRSPVRTELYELFPTFLCSPPSNIDDDYPTLSTSAHTCVYTHRGPIPSRALPLFGDAAQ